VNVCNTTVHPIYSFIIASTKNENLMKDNFYFYVFGNQN